jgi:type IV pilus assembly protein PilC
MNKYKYRAISDNGAYSNGSIVAENPADLANILRATGLELISFKVEKNKSGFFDKIKQKDLIGIFIHFEQLNKAGVPIVDSISDLKDTAENIKVKNLMQEVHESIKNGSLFSESLAKHPDIFSQVYIGLISTGEKTGNLTDAFASIIDHLKWSMEMKRKTRKALMTPLFGLIMMFITMGIMTTVVVPKVTGFLAGQGIALPPATIALIGFSNFMQNYGYTLPIGLFALIVGVKLIAHMPGMDIKIDNIKLRIPIIGPILGKLDASRFCHFFGMTFKSGLGVIECLDSAAMVIQNRAIKNSIIEVKKQVADGQSLAKAISSTGYFPTMVSRMFKIGEESGNMENALQNIKYFYDREINDSIDRLVGLIQPTLTITMGGMIAWITIAVFGPIYGTFSNIK